MRLEIEPLKENINVMMRSAGYHFINKNGEKAEYNFVRPLTRNPFPRFHAFLKINGQKLTVNLHLDQKAPIYKGTAAHSGEYEGSLLENEADRLKKIASRNDYE